MEKGKHTPIYMTMYASFNVSAVLGLHRCYFLINNKSTGILNSDELRIKIPSYSVHRQVVHLLKRAGQHGKGVAATVKRVFQVKC